MKKNKKLILAALGSVMIFLMVFMYILLFTDTVFSTAGVKASNVSATSSKSDQSTAGTSDTSDSSVDAADNTDVGTTTETSRKAETDIKELKVTYVGGTLYAGGRAIAEDFNVEAVHSDGTSKKVTGYTCDRLTDGSVLGVGKNLFVFNYNGAQAKAEVNAIDAHTLAYPPSYVTRHVDADAATAKIAKITNGQMTYDTALASVSFSGDSQIKALWTNGIISQSRIVAETGMSFEYLEAHYNDVVNISQNKSVLVLHYGINTLNVDAQTRLNTIAHYKDLVTRLKTALPNIRIIISGVFPVCNSIYNNQERFQYITSYDFLIFDMCLNLGIDYLSDNEYMVNHQNVFGSDGLHLTPEFYNGYWLENLIKTMGI